MLTEHKVREETRFIESLSCLTSIYFDIHIKKEKKEAGWILTRPTPSNLKR